MRHALTRYAHYGRRRTRKEACVLIMFATNISANIYSQIPTRSFVRSFVRSVGRFTDHLLGGRRPQLAVISFRLARGRHARFFFPAARKAIAAGGVGGTQNTRFPPSVPPPPIFPNMQAFSRSVRYSLLPESGPPYSSAWPTFPRYRASSKRCISIDRYVDVCVT